jgi:8-oxoguanine deaminase
MSKILIKRAHCVATFDAQRRVLDDCDVLLEGKEVRAIGSNLEHRADRIIEASGMIVLPGLINTHHHLYQTLTRCLPEVEDVPLFEWLTKLYEVWRELTPEAVYVSALVGLGELLLTGCTTTTDQLYLFPQAASGEGHPANSFAGTPLLIDEEIRAARDLGIRFHPCRGSMSLGKSAGGLPPDDVVQREEAILEDSERLIQTYHDPAKFAMCKIALSPCSPFSITEQLMRETAALARRHNVRLHTHLAETRDEEKYCLERYGCRPFDLVERCGWLGEDARLHGQVWFAHCVHLNENEIERMAATGCGVAHCPTSNMRLGSGVAPVPKMLERGVAVGLAVDGSASNDSSDMLGEVRNCLLANRVKWGAGAMSAIQSLELATRGGARVLGRDDIGSIEIGKAADLILIEIDRLGYAGAMHDPLAAVVLCGDSHIVHTSIINGEVIVENGKLGRVDEAELVERANRIASDMIARARLYGQARHR